MLSKLRLASAVVVFCCAAFAHAEVFFKEDFSASGWEDRWITSAKSDTYGKFKLTSGEFHGAKNPEGIKTSDDAHFYAISSKAANAFDNKDKDLVLQYSAKYEQKIDCGGAYIKVLPATVDQKEFNGDSVYSIMFGPDFCGGATQKLHFILNYNGKNHDWKKSVKPPKDQLTHLYTAIIHPDNTYEVQIDGEKVESGSLEEDWDLLPSKEIADPEAKKPEDWVDEEMMVDPEDKKPEDWDQPETIPDEEAKKPEDWDDEEDGEWQRPTIPNPEYKGEWKPRMVKNPAYKGVWTAPLIPNPEYKPDANLYLRENLQGVGIDVWQVKSGTVFDNFLITDSVETAAAEAKEVAEFKKEEEAAFKAHEEEERKKREEERKKKEEEMKKQKEEEEKKKAEEEKAEEVQAEEDAHDEL